MRQFYLEYKDQPNLQRLVGEIPWGQNLLIMSKLKDPDERLFLTLGDLAQAGADAGAGVDGEVEPG